MKEDEIFSHLTSLEKDLQRFEVRSNSKELLKILAPTFFEFTSSGRIISREDFLNRLPTEDDKSRMETLNFKLVSISDSAAHITYTSKRINSDGSSLQFLRSSLWKKNNGQWQLEFQQGTIKS